MGGGGTVAERRPSVNPVPGGAVQTGPTGRSEQDLVLSSAGRIGEVA
jgi:hypothetical protein